ncbi:hypothetical protein DVH24_017004 [Malus domestica]|uniref:Uncharacterized protein n=1 Tax=Malus domestica TaxID=3750 RepID=A0A498IXD6_MALDO|nr:hypothetical protein DVH24_017004 [Malus domestica]
MRPFGSSLASDFIGTPKLTSSGNSNPRSGDPLEISRMSSHKQNVEGVNERGREDMLGSHVGDVLKKNVTSHVDQGSGSCKPYISCESNLIIGDPLGSSRVNSRKQNREGVVGPKADNIVLRWSRTRDVVGARARI